MLVLDTSALLAVLFAEPAASWVAERMNEHAADLRMSTVNLAETLILVRDRQSALFPTIERRLLDGSIRFEPPTVEHARMASEARMRFPLNLGDCFAYALANEHGAPILTLDHDFRRTGLQVLAPPRA
jgi:ribonuclease VapC